MAIYSCVCGKKVDEVDSIPSPTTFHHFCSIECAVAYEHARELYTIKRFLPRFTYAKRCKPE